MPGPQEKRVQELHAELALPDPALALAVWHDRQMIDEDRPGAPELDVIGGGVGQSEAVGEQLGVEIEVQQRGRLQGRKGPFIGIGNEVEPRVLEPVLCARHDLLEAIFARRELA